MQSLPVIASENEEEFNLPITNVVSRVHKSNNLKKISYFRSDPFTFIDLELPTNSYMIACIDTQGFEEGENCASTNSVEHTLESDMEFIGSDMILFGYDMILLGSRVQ